MILICGIPNAGKTTLSKYFKNVVHWDDMKLRSQDRRQHVIDIVKSSSDSKLCIEGVYHEASTRTALVEASKGYNLCVWLDTPENVCLERELNYRRRPSSLVTHHAKIFQPPTYEEGWDKIVVVRDNKVSFISKE